MALRIVSLGILFVSTALSCGCGPRHTPSEWRTPPTARPACTADTQCSSGICVIELGASKGTCEPSSLPQLPGRDAGAPLPPPVVRPSSSDIQI